ncbi:hypothetical protein BDA96_02G342000 [Sorghum bicolor]|uniref:Uncharacterized protein n=1 Tax=Sorghum bicolor TaxID=4558 RepID=A0A921RSB9_SORBI|nr:hypothetical protein BDA96_02G342000 [Sorghum bicolor]
MQEWNGIEKCDQLHIRRSWMDCGLACSKLASPPLVPGQSRHLVPVSAGELPGREMKQSAAIAIVVVLTPRRCRLRLYER